ncbi:MAG: hypothetical protein COU35_02555 [Candidatus Magasanikbacteria bacterium CG10_big_fil_rev_8_21_14_0_10_47_10]|uniref:Uncharacterized protein n=1 Tax=Candidatus Magasanikbacteria bacterium CG10_big_fil_rev_8_21_14_0_10_47_10 TaxID=1974652 RepID=A0A2H0TQM3_9BACT|nr:MAG: hypothetical protein COU35_02555 [Candidatus Magasanikbacteria bacterium CG10_big_fil_rev_8_21_14_0_10_47_10]
MQQFALTLLQTVAMELIAVLGIFFALGFLLSKVQKATHENYTRTIGWKGILLTAWIGTPIHELGHAFFAKLFHHKISNITLFQPNKSTGGLGHVEHSFNSNSVYQRIGNFFIGAAPLFFGGAALIGILYFVLPNGKDIIAMLNVQYDSVPSAIDTLKNVFFALIQRDNLNNTIFWIFVYISFCISAHMAPSKQDVKGMWRGFAWLVGLLVIFNFILMLMNIDPREYVMRIASSLSIIVAVFVYALLIATVHYVVTFILLRLPFQLLRR